MLCLVLLLTIFGPSNSVFAQDDQYNFTDVRTSPTVFETTELPMDEDGNLLERYMASVGNGHVATTIYTDTVYVNGLYDGERGDSHRARIPSRNNIRVSVDDGLSVTDRSYAFDLARGVFVERFSTADYHVELRTYAHHFYHKVIVTQVHVTPTTPVAQTLEVWVTSTPGNLSADVEFGPEAPYNSSVAAVYQCGRVREVEDADEQPVPPGVCVVYTLIPASSLLIGESTLTYFAAYDSTLDGAASDFDAVSQLVTEGWHEELYQSHVTLWAGVWNEGLVEVEGNLDLAKLMYGCLYYILSSAPITTPTHGPVGQFYGLSPGGLAYGALAADYQGHSFWDTETWMSPNLLFLYPEVIPPILSYRLAMWPAAREHANETGYEGARFPWESAATGREVTPDCCPQESTYEMHVTADLSYLIRQYVGATRDVDWLKTPLPEYLDNGCALVRVVAHFWTSKAAFNDTTRLHDIRHVMGPDEDHYDIDNNGFTNVQAGYSIFYAKYAECLCDGAMEEPVPDDWVELASSLALPYDATLDYHPEYEGYPRGEVIKQADAVLLGYPLLYAMEASTRRNDLLTYANVTREDGPGLTWAMHTVGFLELDDLDQAELYFNRSYQWYQRQPFKVWTEKKPPTLGTVNFISGMGGFLQSIFGGYAGLRLHPEQLVISKPRPLPHSVALNLVGLHYLGNVFNLNISATVVTLQSTSASSQYPLVVESNGVTVPFDWKAGQVPRKLSLLSAPMFLLVACVCLMHVSCI